MNHSESSIINSRTSPCQTTMSSQFKNMFSKLKDDKYISMYIPDYLKCQLPEKEFYRNIVLSLYPEQMYDLAKTAQEKRAVTEYENRADKIELTEEIAKEINDFIALPSKIYYLKFHYQDLEESYNYSKSNRSLRRHTRSPKDQPRFSWIKNFEPTWEWKSDLIQSSD